MKATHTAWALSSDFFAIRAGSESNSKLVAIYDDCTNVLTITGADDIPCDSLEEAMEIVGGMK